MPIAENLTVRALRMKGVPEADIVAATGNPELQRLIVRNYGSRPAGLRGMKSSSNHS
jgi:hypothetical protein